MVHSSFHPRVWKTITLGAGLNTPDDFREALRNGHCHVNDVGNDLLGKVLVDRVNTQIVELATASVAELGFERGASYEDVCKHSRVLGLHLCPPEVGPQLRLQYPDQPSGEVLRVAMEPITATEYPRPCIFAVSNDLISDKPYMGRWLLHGYGAPTCFCFSDYRFVFQVPTNKQ